MLTFRRLFHESPGFLALVRPEAQMFGGPDQTPPIRAFSKHFGSVMTSYLATGPTNKRHGQVSGPIEVGRRGEPHSMQFLGKNGGL